MKISDVEVRDAAGLVKDPELHIPLGELGMVADVDVSRKGVIVTVLLPVSDYPSTAELERRVVTQVLGLDGVDKARVDFEVMDDDQREVVQSALGRSADTRRADGHDNIRSNVFRTGESSARVIAIASGKGGVGKSSITTNLAVALAGAGSRVGVIDADIYGFSIPRMLGVDRPPTVIGETVIPPVVDGVGTISMGFFVDEDRPVMWRGPMIHKAMEQFLVDVYWGGLDYLLIDMPPGTGDVAISMSQFLPDIEIVVVTTPQPAAQRVAQRSGAMAQKLNQHVLGVIENMSWFELPGGERRELFGSGGGELLASELDAPLIGRIPFDEALRIGSDEGEPIVATDPTNPAASAIIEVARWIESRPRRKIRRPELQVTPV